MRGITSTTFEKYYFLNYFYYLLFNCILKFFCSKNKNSFTCLIGGGCYYVKLIPHWKLLSSIIHRVCTKIMHKILNNVVKMHHLQNTDEDSNHFLIPCAKQYFEIDVISIHSNKPELNEGFNLSWNTNSNK